MNTEQFRILLDGLNAGMRPSLKQVKDLAAAYSALLAKAPQPEIVAATDALDWVDIPGNGKDIAPFQMSRFPVTQAQWRKVMGTDPSYHKGDNRPVERVSWLEAVEFCEKTGARLPTEQEWEWAALGGGTDDPYGPIEDIAWVYENSDAETHYVGLKLPNGYGLYDMLGNVWEWTDSKDGEARVFRGGSCYLNASYVRSADRGGLNPADRFGILGFRCARGVGGVK